MSEIQQIQQSEQHLTDVFKAAADATSPFDMGYKLGLAHQALRQHVERFGSTPFLVELEGRILALLEAN